MYLGIDIGKADFHCALLLEEKVASKSFPNNGKGFNQLVKCGVYIDIYIKS